MNSSEGFNWCSYHIYCLHQYIHCIYTIHQHSAQLSLGVPGLERSPRCETSRANTRGQPQSSEPHPCQWTAYKHSSRPRMI